MKDKIKEKIIIGGPKINNANYCHVKKNQKKRDWNQNLYILAISIGGPNQRNQNIRTGKIEGIKNKKKNRKYKDWNQTFVYNQF